MCAFSDAHCAGQVISSKSTSGFLVRLKELSACVCWSSKLQQKVALRLKKNACTSAVQELMHVCGLLHDLGVSVEKLEVFVDNEAGLFVALNKHSSDHKTFCY